VASTWICPGKHCTAARAAEVEGSISKSGNSPRSAARRLPLRLSNLARAPCRCGGCAADERGPTPGINRRVPTYCPWGDSLQSAGPPGGPHPGIFTAFVYTAVYRLTTGNSTSRVFAIPLLQELSNELSTIRKLLAGVATHAATNMPEKSTPKPTGDAPRCLALFAATLPTHRPFNCTPFPPTPPPLGTPITARDKIADRNGGINFPSARRRRCTCQLAAATHVAQGHSCADLGGETGAR